MEIVGLISFSLFIDYEIWIASSYLGDQGKLPRPYHGEAARSKLGASLQARTRRHFSHPHQPFFHLTPAIRWVQ